jgi:hypothetical protein
MEKHALTIDERTAKREARRAAREAKYVARETARMARSADVWARRGKHLVSAGKGLFNLGDWLALKTYDASKALLRPGNLKLQGHLRKAIARHPVLGATALLSPTLFLRQEEPYSKFEQAIEQGRTPMMPPQPLTNPYKTAAIKKTANPTTMQTILTALGGWLGKGTIPTTAKGLTSALSGKGLGIAAGLAGGAVLGPQLGTWGYQLRKSMNPGIGGLATRAEFDEELMRALGKGLGTQMGKDSVGLTIDATQKGLTTGINALHFNPQRKAILETLMASDDILSRANVDDVLEAYQTMDRFAPTLATDVNAVKSFLREAVVSGAGADYATIANLAKAEMSVNPPMNKRGSAQTMNININKLMKKEALDKIRAVGLHKLAAARLKLENIDVGDELDLQKTAYVLGRKLREKNAVANRVISGLIAMRELNK